MYGSKAISSKFIASSSKVVYWFLVLFIVVNIFACSSAPSDQELIRAVTGNSPLSGHLYQIQNLNRINGYETPNGYTIQFSCQIFILEDPTEYFDKLTKSGSNPIGAIAAFSFVVEGITRWGMLNAALFSTAKKGDVLPFSGSISMIKSEQGWIQNPF